MTCAFAHDDGAYVLGALSPAGRKAFSQHLPTCGECTRSVISLAGLPGLLGRVDADVLEHPPVEEPPTTLLPALVGEVRGARRRRTVVTAGLAAAAAVLATAPLALWQLGADPTPAPVPGASASQGPGAAQRMAPVGEVPVRATVRLEEVRWGTRLGLTCTYDPETVDLDLPPEVAYVLVVRDRSGRLERVGSWRSVSGREMQVTAATALTPAELASVEVRTTDGRVVLRLAT